jgi:hypothetical protein
MHIAFMLQGSQFTSMSLTLSGSLSLSIGCQLIPLSSTLTFDWVLLEVVVLRMVIPYSLTFLPQVAMKLILN